MNKSRSKVETLVYEVMDKLDKTGENTQYYKEMFSKMSDEQFVKFFKGDLPLRFMTKPFVIEPTTDDIRSAFEYINVPMLEKVALPYAYEDQDSNPIMSQPSLVIYIHVKKMKQFITKKNAMSTGIDARDMRTGLLTFEDKNGKQSDREMEALAVMGLDETMKELSTWRADYMNAKSQAYQTINLTGKINNSDIDLSADDSLARNMINAYLVGAMLETNILNIDNMTPATYKEKQRKVQREV